MQGENRNIYQTARKAAGYTQEAAAELLALRVESIRAYETGIRVPGNETVERMVEVYNTQHLAYQHLKATNALMSRVVPALEERSLTEAAVRLVNRMNRMIRTDAGSRLLEITEDGEVTGDEVVDVKEIAADLHELIKAAMEMDLIFRQKEAEQCPE